MTRSIKAPILLSILSVFLFTSCSHNLVGTWTVQKYERVTPGQQGTSLQNIGTITFHKDRSGEKNLDYTVLGVRHTDTQPFTWSVTEQYVTIEGDDSELAKTWIYLENKGDFQKMKSTDGENNVQTLELVKE